MGKRRPKLQANPQVTVPDTDAMARDLVARGLASPLILESMVTPAMWLEKGHRGQRRSRR